MMVSIKDIGRAAGVSHSTVSRALSNNPLIPEATRLRIHRTAQKMGYAPNAIARGLVTRRTQSIGVIVTTIEDPFNAEIVRGIEEIAAANNYRVFLGTSHNEPSREVGLVRALREWRVDGVIVASSRVGALYQPLLKETGAPIVLINNQKRGSLRERRKAGDIHTIVFDDTEGGEIATRFLVSQGHRAIAYLGGPADYVANHNRLTGYRRALAKAKIPFDAAFVQAGNGRVDSGEQVLQFFSRRVDHKPSRRDPESDHGALRVPTAIFCYNDMIAIGALSALKSHGLRVPDDVSVVGFDDIPFAAYVDPPLTTIHQPKDEMGRLAMRMLFDLLDGKRASNVMLSGKLIVRESTHASTDKPALEQLVAKSAAPRDKVPAE